MSTLAIDIETASPQQSPGPNDMDNTDYFELVAVGLGYRDAPSAPIETDVLFRDGGWEISQTTDLLTRVSHWIKQRNPNTVITYNGTNFDAIHLQNWAQDADDTFNTKLHDTFTSLFDDDHIDLMRPSVAMYAPTGHDRISLEDALDTAGAPVPETRYSDYDLPQAVTTSLDTDTVKNTHIGTVLGEHYVTNLEADGSLPTHWQPLEALLEDYTEADIAPLFELSDSLRARL